MSVHSSINKIKNYQNYLDMQLHTIAHRATKERHHMKELSRDLSWHTEHTFESLTKQNADNYV